MTTTFRKSPVSFLVFLACICSLINVHNVEAATLRPLSRQMDDDSLPEITPMVTMEGSPEPVMMTESPEPPVPVTPEVDPGAPVTVTPEVGPVTVTPGVEPVTMTPGVEPGPPVTTLPGPPVGGTCEAAERACVLGFEGVSGIFTIDLTTTTPNVPFSPSIVAKDSAVSIGIVNSNIEGEFILDDGTMVPFSNIPVPDGQSITPNFFKPLTMMSGKTSGIAHETPQIGQVPVLINKCVRVFITEWQVLNADGSVKDNINGMTNKRDNVCVVFRTTA